MADLATQLLAIGSRIADLDPRIAATFRPHPQAENIESLPGMGPILGTEIIAAAGDLHRYNNAGWLASAARLVPVPKDLGCSRSYEQRLSCRCRDPAYLSAAGNGPWLP